LHPKCTEQVPILIIAADILFRNPLINVETLLDIEQAPNSEDELNFTITSVTSLNNSVVHRPFLSSELCVDLLECSDEIIISRSNYFPSRHLTYPDEALENRLVEAIPYPFKNPRIYRYDHGIVKPHQDQIIYPDYEHTGIIYLTDDYEGGRLTIEGHGEIEPQSGWGVIFPKRLVHSADEMFGIKIILVLDVEMKDD
jgi:2OG-Fe(II) oxygenase superfamily